jgi:hypothetical protein
MKKPEEMKVAELRAALKTQGLPTDGRKKDLLQRLLNSGAHNNTEDTATKEQSSPLEEDQPKEPEAPKEEVEAPKEEAPEEPEESEEPEVEPLPTAGELSTEGVTTSTESSSSVPSWPDENASKDEQQEKESQSTSKRQRSEERSRSRSSSLIEQASRKRVRSRSPQASSSSRPMKKVQGGGYGGKQKYPPRCRLFVGRIDTTMVTPATLRGVFAQFGDILEDPLILNHARCGFVQYGDPTCIGRAVSQMNGQLVHSLGSQSLIVQEAKPRREKDNDRQDDRRNDRYSNDQYNRRSQSRGRDYGRSRLPIVPGGRGASGTAECIVVMLGTGQRAYGEEVAQKVSGQARLHTVIRHRNQMPIPLIVEDVERSGASYCCVVGSKNEVNRTCNFRDFRNDGKSRLQERRLDEIVSIIIENDRRNGFVRAHRPYTGPEYLGNMNPSQQQHSSSNNTSLGQRGHYGSGPTPMVIQPQMPAYHQPYGSHPVYQVPPSHYGATPTPTQYGAPQPQYGTSQTQYGAPPPAQAHQPPPSYGQVLPPPPQQQHYAPPTQPQYGAAPPAHQYGAPPAPPQQQHYAPQTQPQYGAPQPSAQQQQYVPPAPPAQSQYSAPPPASQYSAPPTQQQQYAPQTQQYAPPQANQRPATVSQELASFLAAGAAQQQQNAPKEYVPPGGW